MPYFLGFLSELIELVRVAGSVMLQIRKYDQSFLMLSLFANFAHSSSSYCCYGNVCVIIFVAVVKYLILEIPFFFKLYSKLGHRSPLMDH